MEVVFMYQRITTMIAWVLLFLFAFDAYALFLSLRKSIGRFIFLILFAGSAALTAAALCISDNALHIAASFSAVIILFPFFFYQGAVIKKVVVTIIIYLSFMIADILASLAGYFIQIIFTAVPVTGNLFLTGPPVSLISYNIIFSILFLLCRRFILPQFTRFFDVFGVTFFIRITGPFLMIYLVSNIFLTLIYSDSVIVFSLCSLGFLLFTGILTKYALRSFRIFIEQENQHTQLLLQKGQLEQLTDHLNGLSKKYTDIRRQNHDMSGHLTALSYLIDTGQWDDAADYIDSLILRRKPRE